MTPVAAWAEAVAQQRAAADVIDALAPGEGERCADIINNAHEVLLSAERALKTADHDTTASQWRSAFRIVRDAALRFNRRAVRAEILATIASVSRDAHGVLARVGEAMAHGR